MFLDFRLDARISLIGQWSQERSARAFPKASVGERRESGHCSEDRLFAKHRQADLRGHRGARRARQQSSFGSARSATGFAQRPASGSSEQCWATQTRTLLQAQSDQKCVSASPLLPSPPPSNLLRVTLPIHHLKNVPGQHRYQRVSIFLAPSSSSFDSGAGCDRRRATLSGRLAPCFR